MAAAPVANDRPLCQYGSKCYRKNPIHLAQYRHDSNSISSNSNVANDARAVPLRPEAAAGMGRGGVGSRGGRGGAPRVSPYFAAGARAPEPPAPAGTGTGTGTGTRLVAAPAAAAAVPAAGGSDSVEQIVDLISDED